MTTSQPPVRKGPSSDTGNAGHFAATPRDESETALAPAFDLDAGDELHFSHANGDFATGHDGFIDGVSVVADDNGNITAYSRFDIELSAYLGEEMLEENREAVVVWFENEFGAVIDLEYGWADAEVRYPLHVDAGSTADSLLADAKLNERAKYLHRLAFADPLVLRTAGLKTLGTSPAEVESRA